MRHQAQLVGVVQMFNFRTERRYLWMKSKKVMSYILTLKLELS